MTAIWPRWGAGLRRLGVAAQYEDRTKAELDVHARQDNHHARGAFRPPPAARCRGATGVATLRRLGCRNAPESTAFSSRAHKRAALTRPGLSRIGAPHPPPQAERAAIPPPLGMAASFCLLLDISFTEHQGFCLSEHRYRGGQALEKRRASASSTAWTCPKQSPPPAPSETSPHAAASAWPRWPPSSAAGRVGWRSRRGRSWRECSTGAA